jgi:ribosomal protein L11
MLPAKAPLLLALNKRHGEKMLTEQQKHKFEVTRQMAKEELEALDKEISAELAKVKDKLLELQQAKKAVKQIYDGACARMGVKSVLEVTDLNLTDLVKSA